MMAPTPFESHPALVEETTWVGVLEGELAVDVWSDPDNFYVRAAIAGVAPEELEITLESDLLTIRGTRSEEPPVPEESLLVRECHFGSFSRTIILPEETNPDGVSASLKNGVLIVTIPKIKGGTVRIPIDIKNETA